MIPHVRRCFTSQWLAATVLCCSRAVGATRVEPVPDLPEPFFPREQDEGLSFGVACTLMAGMAFTMIMLYLVKATDDGIRRYTWVVLCTTVSIFCSVLMFDGVDSTVHAIVGIFIKDVSQGLTLYINMILMFIWSTALHVCIYYYPNKQGYALLLAHATGFAAINGWGTVQQFPFFSGTALMAVLSVPLSFYGILVMTRLNEFAIAWYVKLTGHLHPRCEEEVLEAENDVIGFCCSFQTVQALRLLVSKSLPENDGTEDDEQLFNHKKWEIAILFIVGCVFLTIASVVYLEEAEAFGDEDASAKGSDEEEEQKKEETSMGKIRNTLTQVSEQVARGLGNTPASKDAAQRKRTSLRKTVQKRETMMFMPAVDRVDDSKTEEERKKEHKEIEEEASESGPFSVKRLADCLVLYLSMVFAFCTFYAGYWLVAITRITYEKCLLGLGLAMMLSIFSFSFICLLEPIGEHGGASLHRIIHEIVQCLAILVGLSWERSFDVATDVLAEFTPSPTVATLCLAIFCTALLVPAWERHMLPMVTHDGWRFGILPYKWNKVVLGEVIEELTDYRDKIVSGQVAHHDFEGEDDD